MLHAGLVNHLRLVVGQLTHRRNLLTPAVGYLLVHGLMGRLAMHVATGLAFHRRTHGV